MGLYSSEAYNTEHIWILLFTGTCMVLKLETFQITLDAFQVTKDTSKKKMP
jgi:hypothetical protein